MTTRGLGAVFVVMLAVSALVFIDTGVNVAREGSFTIGAEPLEIAVSLSDE